MREKTKLIKRLATVLMVAGIAFILAGCFFDGQRRTRYNASVVDYLYPGGTSSPVEPTIPTLSLPLKVGVAFVPGKGKERYTRHDAIISEVEKSALLEEVSRNFREYKFVKEIQVIPGVYLREGGSFENLDQVAKLFGVDVIALVSYDQMQFRDQDAVSLVYWTIAGAYLVPGDKNDTQTMIDAVVYDVTSRSLLFRAPGTSRIKGRTTPVNASEEERKDAQEGFKQAATNLVQHLKVELASFQEKVKSRPNDYKVVAKPGYSGGGNSGWLGVCLSFGAMALAWKNRTQRREKK